MITEINAKTILGHHSKPDSWFGHKYTMNIYRGCEHRCIYCDSRSECYGIENFDKEIIVKKNAITLLKDELPQKRIKGTIGTGAMSDPYTYIEKDYRLTRRALELIAGYKFPLSLLTKSDMILRDIDVISEIAKTYASIAFTVTTFDDDLASKLEPGASKPSNRFAALKRLSDSGIYTGVLLMPLLPFINDTVENVVNIVKQAADCGVKYIMPSFGVTLRDRQREFFYKKLDILFPGLSNRYRQTFRESYGCGSPNAKLLYSVFNEACEKYKIEKRMRHYAPHRIAGFGQESLF
ncbi:radical SAM protein [Candidatus Dojkabacteria bacterium]|nr:radical SAM protein [Candidatus Dojkabacteria bacterium]